MNHNAAVAVPAEDDAYESYLVDVREDKADRLRYVEPMFRPDFDSDCEQPDSPRVDEDEIVRRVLKPAVWRRPDAPRDAFHALQRWEGVVTMIEDETFVARLTDLTHEGSDEEVELPLSDIPNDDEDLLEEGAVFYWAIGYRDEASGQRQRVSTLRFRRLPVWSTSELRAARERAVEVGAALGVKGEPESQLGH